MAGVELADLGLVQGPREEHDVIEASRHVEGAITGAPQRVAVASSCDRIARGAGRLSRGRGALRPNQRTIDEVVEAPIGIVMRDHIVAPRAG